MYSSPEFNYPNTGNAEIQLTTGGLTLTPGADYVMFLSVSQYYGQSSGLSYVSSGSEPFPEAASRTITIQETSTSFSPTIGTIMV